MVDSSRLVMGFRRFLLLAAFPVALTAGASCAPLALSAGLDFGTGGLSGAGGNPFQTTTGTVTIGGGGQGNDGGVMIPMLPPPGSLDYLCGGSQAHCTPGADTDLCAQGGNPGMGGAPPTPPDGGTQSCRLVAPRADAGSDAGVTGVCAMSGAAPEGAPCTSAADCAAGLGCLAGLAPVCRAYCCDSPESCPTNTYCIAGEMNEAPANRIPVCFPVMPCQLLPDSCPAGLACAIVRMDGTTSCVTPGPGTEGHGCPCAKGFTCSQPDGTCLKLCLTSKGTCPSGQDCSCPPGEICQGGTYPYVGTDGGPSDIGICVK